MTLREYRDRAGRAIEFAGELGAGGEGAVFAVAGRGELCAKIYHAGSTFGAPGRLSAPTAPSPKAAERADKLRAMLARRPRGLWRGALAWPVDLVVAADDPARIAGFLMPAARGETELYRLLVPDERLQFAAWLTLRELLEIGEALAGIVAAVHRAGHCVGDLKPQNVLVCTRSRRVTLVDTDSFQVWDPRARRMHGCPVITPEYTAPELLRAARARAERSPASDDFALAVILHQLLLGGAHPFEGEMVRGRGVEEVERIPERIRRGLCPLAPVITAIRAPAGALPLGLLGGAVREAFVQCFAGGDRDPGARPRAAAWGALLRDARRALVRCRDSAAHWVHREHRGCAWCERRGRTGLDPFPAGQQWQRAMAARLADPAEVPEEERAQWLVRHTRARVAGGRVTPAERRWLEKAGMTLGLGRARTIEIIEAGCAAGPAGGAPWRAIRERVPAWIELEKMIARILPPRRAVLLGAIGLLGSGGALAGVAATAGPPATEGPRPAVAKPATARPRSTCLVAEVPRSAVIGNTRGAGANFRAAPSLSSAKQALPEGTAVRVTGRTHTADDLSWSEVELEPGRGGWVATRYLVDAATAPARR